MRKNGATKQDVRSIAKNLKSLVGEDEMEDVARSTGFLRRKRVLLPHALVLALLTSLGMGKTDWIADILRAYNALTGASLRYKPFHNQLKKLQFPEWMRQVLEIALPSIASERPRRSTVKRNKPNQIYWKDAALPREIEATIMLIRSEK